jgi:hypothetical protein
VADQPTDTSPIFKVIEEEHVMKTLRLISLCLAAFFPLTTTADVWIPETVSVPIPRATNAGVDEITFEWENAMVLSAADPCASHMAPRYNPGTHEGNYDDDGNEFRI